MPGTVVPLSTSGDCFHPNDAGAATYAEKVAEAAQAAIESGLIATPTVALATPGTNDDLISDLRARIERDPTDASTMSLLAELLYYDDNVGESIAWFQRGLDVEPDNTAIRLIFAQILSQADKPNDAEIQFLKVLEVEPNNYEAHYYLAELYRFWDPRRRGDAAEHYRRVIEIAPDSYPAEQAAIQLAALGYATPAPSGAPVATPAVVTPSTPSTGGFAVGDAAVVNDASVSLRATPSADGEVVATLAQGTRVNLIAPAVHGDDFV